ncbi:EAL domain-containing protein [Thermoleophilia bacterium SCSIO 60948]|nr:EAL domain-containing protein [Thermoleophilia bacterium SCSIO 60948]
MNDGLLTPHFQPIVRLADERVYGREALIRADLDGRRLNGGELVDAARSHGEIFAFDQRCRTAAIETAAPMLPDGETLFINFNPSAIYDPDICLRTTWAVARRHDFSLSRVCFEVVESERFPDIEFLRRILDRYRAEGARVALDDLGAGHTSLNYLRELRPDIVKLDRALVAGIDADESRQRLVAALIDYSHDLGIDVVAEGIETVEEARLVRSLGADLGQGWFFGRPEPRIGAGTGAPALATVRA